MAALYQRERTGEGQFVEASMQDAVYPSLMSQLANYYNEDDTPPRTGNRHSSLAKAPYNAYEAEDGYVAILCISDEHWETLCGAIDREDLADDEQFVSNVDRVEHMETIDDAIEEWTCERSREEIGSVLSAAGVLCGSVQSVEKVIYDPHLEEREIAVEIDHPSKGEIRVPGSPIRLSKSKMPEIEPSPRKGEDNYKVYRDRIGLSEEKIERLRTNGVI
nr:CaiB/BaiF CoA-transferase family protein [Halalkalicoccus subterraneus]